MQEAIEENNGSKKRRLPGAGRKLKDQEMDAKLIEWVRSMRSEKNRVTRAGIQRYARSIKGDLDFKASNGWLQRFMKRHNLASRRPTTVCQKLPDEYTQKIVDFLLYVEKIKMKNNYGFVYACDETAVYIDNSNSLIVDTKGVSQVTVRTTGHDKMHITVMLCARSDGFKCRPYVLLPNKRPIAAIVEKFKNELELSWSGRTFFNDELTRDFLTRVMGTTLFAQRLLVWDSFRCHISDETKKHLRSLKIDTAVVPGGTTKYLQAPDVFWNAVFKSKIRQYYEQWMQHGVKTYTTNGNMRAPSMETYLQWVCDSWKSLPQDLIKKSFVGCGLNNVPGGADDHQIQCLKHGSEIKEGLQLLKKTREEKALMEIEEQLMDVSIGEEQESLIQDSEDYDSDASIDF